MIFIENKILHASVSLGIMMMDHNSANNVHNIVMDVQILITVLVVNSQVKIDKMFLIACVMKVIISFINLILYI